MSEPSAGEVLLYVTPFCPYCIRAKQLLERKGVPYRELRVDRDPALRAEMERRSGRTTVPQIFIGRRHVGGCDDIYALEGRGELDALLEQELGITGGRPAAP
ncbi:MAG: glutaredoxin 3 [Gammaproteobacteria bacterium]|nr:MAG: glutaredoxin 3 [Gammaproteobacteria bacterium]